MSDEPDVVEPVKPSKLLPILVMLNLGVTGLVAARVMLLPTELSEVSAEAEASAEPRGPVVDLETPFVVNLNEPEGGRYLKVQLAVEVAGDDEVSALREREQVVRDDLLRYLSGLSVEQTMGEANKDRIQENIVARLDEQLGGGGRVHRVLFSEFVVQ